jgi:hypothetical protein
MTTSSLVSHEVYRTLSRTNEVEDLVFFASLHLTSSHSHLSSDLALGQALKACHIVLSHSTCTQGMAK